MRDASRNEVVRARVEFWKDVYVAAVRSGQSKPNAIATQAASDYDDMCSSEQVRAELERPPEPTWQSLADDSLRQNKKIEAIKIVRAHTPGMGLKEAKYLVEARMQSGEWGAP